MAKAKKLTATQQADELFTDFFVELLTKLSLTKIGRSTARRGYSRPLIERLGAAGITFTLIGQTAEADKSLGKRLNAIISHNLWDPGGDPDEDNLLAAADAYKALKERGLPVAGDQDVVNQLRRDNICEEDFLSDMPNAPPTTEIEG